MKEIGQEGVLQILNCQCS